MTYSLIKLIEFGDTNLAKTHEYPSYDDLEDKRFDANTNLNKIVFRELCDDSCCP